MRRLLALCLTIAIIMGVTACTMESSPRQRDDGLHGITNANPNLRTGDAYTPTINDDRNRIQEAALRTEGVRKARVALLGGRALVRITPQPGLSQEEYKRLSEEVQRNISKVMPRYAVRVVVQHSSGFRWPFMP